MSLTKQHMQSLIHESNLIEGYDDPEFDAQSWVAWTRLRRFKKLDHGVICRTQKIITLKQNDLQPNWRGYYRSMNGIRVQVGGRDGMEPAAIDNAMTNWLSFLDFTHPHVAHVEFEKIHPFVDGNGRTGRMLMWWQQLQRDEPLTIITFDKREEYYRWFQ